MDYNSNRKKLKLPEYGRNIQKMVDYAVSLEDREERNRAVRQIIEIMGNMYPYLRDIPDFRHKLWDHIAIMADFNLDIDYPYDPPKPETFIEKPKRVPYEQSPIKYRHYGKIMSRMVEEVSNCEKEQDKEVLTRLLANHMKKSFLIWNKDTVNDDKIFEDFSDLSHGKTSVPTNMRLSEVRDILKPAQQKKKGKGGQQNHGRKHK